MTRLSDDFALTIPIEVSYAAINQQLKAQLPKNPVSLPKDASVAITDARIASYGGGLLLTVEFSGKNGWSKSASGRLYFVGVPVFDAGNTELRVENLEYSAETKSILVKTADWLAHPEIREALKTAAVFKLEGEFSKAKAKANEEIGKLKLRSTKEVAANLKVTRSASSVWRSHKER